MHPLTKLIREDMKPALGVTEPGAIAFAVAKARKYLQGEVRKIHLRLNSGMLKNAYTCGIPRCSRVGSLYAAALGALAADPQKGLECLEGIKSLICKVCHNHWCNTPVNTEDNDYLPYTTNDCCCNRWSNFN